MTVVDPQLFSQHVVGIPGWFGLEDFTLFSYFLETSPPGDILELGVYRGRSAVVLGRALRTGEQLHACDLFDADGSGLSTEGYDDHARQSFERTYAEVNPTPAVVHAMASSEALVQLKGKTLRFAHIDASHLFENVTADITGAVELMAADGIIVVDDYRSHHTPGVAAAFWSAVQAGVIAPVALSYQKAYCVLPDHHSLALANFQQAFLADNHFVITEDKVLGCTVVAARMITPRSEWSEPRLASGSVRLKRLVKRAQFVRAAVSMVRLHPLLRAEVTGPVPIPIEDAIGL